MRLASEDILIKIDGESITLRPSLRAGLRLTRKYETLAAIANGIAEGSFTVISDVIANGSLYPNACERLFSDIDQQPLSRVLAILQKPLIDFAVSLAGTNDDDSDTKPEGETTSFVEHYERLFGIATGHLGWSPAEAWNATPTEVLAAHKGRVVLLEMIFGTGEKKPGKPLSLDQKARLAFASIGTKKVQAA